MDVGTALVGIILGAVLALLALAWAASARHRARTRRHARVDDLADFLEHPPGTRAEPPQAAGWAALAPAPPGPPRGATAGRWWAAAGAAVTAVALTGAVVVATGSSGGRSEPLPTTARPAEQEPDHGSLVADLAFAGLVLEQRAVGITAAYPDARLTADGDRTRLTVRLPTYNCLAAAAPPDPEAAGCVAAGVERGTLQGPDLQLERDGDRLLLRGELATWTTPTGSPPEPTGRVYPLELVVSPGDDVAPGGWRDALGRLRLGTSSAPADDGSRLRAAG